MNNKKIIIDAGHGGIDSGAVGNNLLEKELTLEISKYIYNRLNELGLPVVMTREEDIYLPKAERIKKVSELVDNSDAILISNHINAGGGEGAEVVYSLRNNSTLADSILDNLGLAGQIKRKTYQRRLPENPNLDYYYILRETSNTEPVLIEYGFIDNKKDAQKLKNNLDIYAEAVVKAIVDYVGYDYNNESMDKYIVKKNDTLYSIAKKYNTTVDNLKKLNNLTNNTLSIGQELLLKENIAEDDYIIYTVKKGDTFFMGNNEYI